jgi:hypothetical protein
MQHFYTHYWKQDTVQWNRDGAKTEGDPFTHTAGNQFDQVRPGDRVYAVSRDDNGDLMLIGRLTVGTVDDQLSDGDVLRAILTQAQAERVAGRALYEAQHHLFAAPDRSEQTATSYRRLISARDAKDNLRFVRPADGAHLAPKLESGGKLDRQTVRGVRRLTPAAAVYLDGALR